MAAIQAILVNDGEALGARLMSEAGCRRVLEVQADGVDLIMGIPLRMGYGLASPVLFPDMTDNTVAFWGDNGGSVSYVDFDHRMSVSYVPNRWIEGRREGDRRLALLRATYAALAG